VSTGGLICSLVSRLCPPHLGPIVFVCPVMTGDVTTIRYQAECEVSFPLSIPIHFSFCLFLICFFFFFLPHCDPSVVQKRKMIHSGNSLHRNVVVLGEISINGSDKCLRS